MGNSQIYSATYSNVPVFEFVTSEGPIMRRKSDSWINATHILKIARFPKAKRTRILEKDVQTGIHEKVQGGYGKYQGTYVPLDIGADIARSFNVFEILRPIFEFKYTEGKSETPPPAPKHSHASASNVSQRQASFSQPARKTKSMSFLSGEPPRKRGRPKRVPMNNHQPTLKQSDTVPIDSPADGGLGPGPNIGTFKRSESASSQRGPPGFSRQETQPDGLLISSNLNIGGDDLEAVESDEDLPKESPGELMSGKELFGTPRDSFEKAVYSHYQHDPYGLLHYVGSTAPNNTKDDQMYNDYFSTLLTYFLDDSKMKSNTIPDAILHPPTPILKINVNRAIDNEGNSIFHWACSMANPTIINFLMETFDIKPDIRNQKGETPLMFLVKFSNSYQLKNFANLLELLLDSILFVDLSGKTVLHHIASIENKNKERFSKYYMETLFAKLIDVNQENDLENNQIMSKFINHQDSEGNTAFHIVAYNLNKKSIKVLIYYHKYIDFSLRNLVGYTVEDYLGWHNYILRLDEEDQDNLQQLPERNNSTQLLESQMHYSKMAMNLHSTTSNLITEKLTELAYAVDKELSETDEKILNYLKILKSLDQEKIDSQKDILLSFKLDYLVDDVEETLRYQDTDHKRSVLIQDEIHRLNNDLCFQTLQQENELQEKIHQFNRVSEHLQRDKLVEVINQQPETHQSSHYGSRDAGSDLSRDSSRDGDPLGSHASADPFNLAVQLTQEILRRQRLSQELYGKQPLVPVSSGAVEGPSQKSIVSSYPKDDKLNKYCKLISLCCGMNFNEVESSIDLLEQSLLMSSK